MRNNWALWKGSELSRWFNEKGIHHPDDMSGIIFDSFWRHLNNQPLKLEEQIKYYQDYWKKADEEYKSNQQVDPIVKTPADEVEAQGTQGHP